jgi:Raf kinase inhibitor-like YbhB/YbcL family protein
MDISSPAFADRDPIPPQYGYTNRNVNPPLSWSGVPEEAVTLALVVDDPDAVDPAGKVWDHWTVWNIDPDRTDGPEAWSPSETGDGVEGTNDFGEVGYGGPNPPDGEHTYEFRPYALDDRLALEVGATKGQLEDAMAGHVLAEAMLHGTYAP